MLSALLLYLLLGACAGVLAGLLGIGGGLVLVAALAWLLPLQGVPADDAMHAALASSMASIVLTAASSAYAHHKRGSVLWPTVAWMVPGVLIGGWFGSRFAIGLDGGSRHERNGITGVQAARGLTGQGDLGTVRRLQVLEQHLPPLDAHLGMCT